MKFTVLQENLKKALSLVGKTVTTKTQLPVLSNILLETEAGKVKISATNLESSVSYWIGATVEKAGALTVPARLFSEIVSSFSHDKVFFEQELLQLKIVCGDSEATLAGIDAGEFPPLPKTEAKKTAVLKKTQLEASLPGVMIAASTDESRPLLTGIRFIHQGNSLVIAATDGFRLSVKKIAEISGLKEEMVIPSRVLGELMRALGETQAEEVDLFFSQDKNQVVLVLENIQITTRLIEGEFPNYEKIIPGGFTTRTKINKADFIKAVKFAGVYAKESANILKLNINPGELVVSANLPQVGENKTKISAETEGESAEIAFNARFLQDLLLVFSGDEVVFEMSGPLAPGVFKNPKDDSFLHIIMPVRVQG